MTSKKDIAINNILDDFEKFANLVLHQLDLLEKIVASGELTVPDQLSEEIVTNEKKIDELEVKISDRIINTIVLYQPVASEIRKIMSCYRIIINLERIGDQVINILGLMKKIKIPDVYSGMAEVVSTMYMQSSNMVNKALVAFTTDDKEFAIWTIKNDLIVDELNSKMIKKAIRKSNVTDENKQLLTSFISLNSMVSNIERIGDHATNIAEAAIYSIEAVISDIKKKLNNIKMKESDDRRILVVDDEKDLCEILEFNLTSEGFLVDVVHSAEDALKKTLGDYDLILLDVMMENISGYKMASIMRNDLKLSVPVIFLTARNTENDILTGFNVGADDYIPKPFSIKEMLARVRAVLKRGKMSPAENKVLNSEGLVVNTSTKMVYADENMVSLTRKEFEILVMLMRHKGHYFSREEILRRIWSDDVIVTERNVDVNIARLRKKIGVYGKYIQGKTGYGYCFID